MAADLPGGEGFDFSHAAVAVVTGGGSGIGRAVCLGLAKRGVQSLVVADIDMEGAEETVAEIRSLGLGTSSRAVHCDVSVEADINSLIDGTEAIEGPVDVFVANAGLRLEFGGIDAASMEEWHLMMAVNVYQSVLAARRLLPSLAERKGAFAVVSSAAGVLTMPGSVAYTTTKHAARALAEWLSVTYGDQGLHVACLCPQAVESKMTAGFSGPTTIPAAAAAESLCKALEEGRFLALPHPKVDKYNKAKAADIDDWLKRVRREQANFLKLSKI